MEVVEKVDTDDTPEEAFRLTNLLSRGPDPAWREDRTFNIAVYPDDLAPVDAVMLLTAMEFLRLAALNFVPKEAANAG